MFIALDGIDGAGKSTQMRLLAQWLADAGQEVVTCRDPGATAVGEKIREVLLSRETTGLVRRSEMLLYMAARAQLVDEVIRPALDAGKIVISDRFLLANVVYQGYAGGLEVEALWDIGLLATDGLLPRLTIVLDLAVESAGKRLDRELDRMEQQGDEYCARLREGYLTEAARRPGEIVVVDAGRSVEAIQADIRNLVASRLAPRPHPGPLPEGEGGAT